MKFGDIFIVRGFDIPLVEHGDEWGFYEPVCYAVAGDLLILLEGGMELTDGYASTKFLTIKGEIGYDISNHLINEFNMKYEKVI